MADFAVGKDIMVGVANDELRTWNPPVDREKATLLEVQKAPVDGYGTSGVRLVFHRRQHARRLPQGPHCADFRARLAGEGPVLWREPHGLRLCRLPTPNWWRMTPKEYPTQFPFRTDYGNEHLPWYQLKAGEAPPRFSEHLVFGELMKVDAAARTGQFRTDRTGELVDFTLIPQGAGQPPQRRRGPADVPPGLRCRFHLYQDEKGAFTRASLVSDEFSYLAANAVTYRVEAMQPDEGKLHVARQIPR